MAFKITDKIGLARGAGQKEGGGGEHVQGNRCEWANDEGLHPGSNFMGSLLTHFWFGSPHSLRPGTEQCFL